ncbi:hypothetical protein COV19_03475 [Candidatus Woesearchaeota archaeon CG10_big_fil_rev_8_21_14_0_10_44_13]|nr:MAG: hypothetical protein COV19_03475 [Candidatus Woesearchaeota archaeon CG10_big_fil_rev_8_21_14_0_10_44_13]
MKQMSEYADKIDYKNPTHWIAGGFVLLALAVMKTILIFLAIGLFIAAIIRLKGEKDETKSC